MESELSISARSLQFYMIGKHWASDLEFFRIETAFLHRLMSSNITRLINEAAIRDITHAGATLHDLEKEEALMNQLLDSQLTKLELIAEDVIPEDMEEIWEKHIELENRVAHLTNSYRQVKKEIFGLVESLMRE